MTTNFFQSIVSLNASGDWKINIAKDTADRLIVSVLFFNESMGDDARKLIPPMILKGTPAELDEGFFETIAAPIEKTSQLFANMEQFLKSVEQAKLQSKMEQGDKQKKSKEESDLEKKYAAQMKKVQELKAQKKYGEAIGQLPKVDEYPEQEEEIQELYDELSELRKEKENTLFK